jgi:hypothetical protein
LNAASVGRKAQHLALLRPFGRQVGETMPMPYGSRPSTAALTRSGARKASEIKTNHRAGSETDRPQAQIGRVGQFVHQAVRLRGCGAVQRGTVHSPAQHQITATESLSPAAFNRLLKQNRPTGEHRGVRRPCKNSSTHDFRDCGGTDINFAISRAHSIHSKACCFHHLQELPGASWPFLDTALLFWCCPNSKPSV